LWSAEARIVGELNRLSIDFVRAARRRGAGGMTPGACAMMHPVHVLRVAHVLMTREAAALVTAAIACCSRLRAPDAGRQGRSRDSGLLRKGIGRFRPPRSGSAMRREAGGGHGVRSHFPAASAASEPVRASLGGRMPEGGKSGALNRQHNLLRETGAPWQGSARKSGRPHFGAYRNVTLLPQFAGVMSADLSYD
jgi:hypothetical protein